MVQFGVVAIQYWCEWPEAGSYIDSQDSTVLVLPGRFEISIISIGCYGVREPVRLWLVGDRATICGLRCKMSKDLKNIYISQFEDLIDITIMLINKRVEGITLPKKYLYHNLDS